MELRINIKENAKQAFFLQLLKEFDYIEILDVKDDETGLPEEHKRLLDERLKRIESGETSFRSWDEIKKKYLMKPKMKQLFINSQEALKNIRGNWADDIIADREERL